MNQPPHEASTSRVISAEQYRRERWRNGLGWTRQVAASHASEAWNWRLSIAEIERDAAFSIFPGVERELVLLQGDGLRLCFEDGETILLSSPHRHHRFSGARALHGELVGGVTLDFNLMWRPQEVGAELLLCSLLESTLFVADARTHWAVHLIAGHARFDSRSGLPPMQAGDTALLYGAPGSMDYVLEGGGELIVVKFSGVSTDRRLQYTSRR